MSTQLPDGELNSALGNLMALTDDELIKLIEDDSAFESFVQNLAQVKQWESEKEMLMTSNKSLAEFNLTYEPKLTEGKAALMELYERARSLGDEVEIKRAKVESLSSRTSLDTTYAVLQTAAAEADEESETFAEKFLLGEVDVDTFVNKFISLRTTAHLRRVKSEKMGDIVQAQRNRSTFSTAPYPTGSPSIPMPGMM